MDGSSCTDELWRYGTYSDADRNHAACTLEEIYQMLAQDAPEVDGVDVSVIHSDKDTVYLAVVCLTQDAEKLEEVLRAVDLQDRPRYGTKSLRQ